MSLHRPSFGFRGSEVLKASFRTMRVDRFLYSSLDYSISKLSRCDALAFAMRSMAVTCMT